jgi:hypothetical protein
MGFGLLIVSLSALFVQEPGREGTTGHVSDSRHLIFVWAEANEVILLHPMICSAPQPVSKLVPFGGMGGYHP